MANPTKSNKLGLRIIGSDGNTSILSTMDMFMKCDLSSGNLNLYTKSKPTGVALPHNTNWDAGINSTDVTVGFYNAARARASAVNTIDFTWKDFSCDRIYDTYYTTAKGRNSIDYNISASWDFNDAVVLDDINIVATKDWMSTEKIIVKTPLTESFKGVSVVTSEVLKHERVYYEVTSETVTAYQFAGSWDSNVTGSGDGVGNIVITYVFGGNVTIYTIVVPPGGNTGDFSFAATELNPTYVWEGTGPDPIEGGWPPSYTTITSIVTTPIPPGAILDPNYLGGNWYYFPSEEYEIYGPSTQVSNIIIPLTHFLLDQNSGPFYDKDGKFVSQFKPIFPYTGPYNEFLDYSDIFFEIDYHTTPEAIGQNITPSDIGNLSRTRTYTFGGYMYYNELINQLNKPVYRGGIGIGIPNHDTTDDEELTWKILLNKDGYQFGIWLSGWVKWYPFDADNIWEKSFLTDGGKSFESFFEAPFTESPPKDFGYNTTRSDYKVLSSFELPHIANIEVYKLINFPNCGKVDIFIKTHGTVEYIDQTTWSQFDPIPGLAYSIITSKNHGLIDRDQIKITQGLSVDKFNQTNMNGIFYVKVHDENRFSICYLKDTRYGNNLEFTDLIPLKIINVDYTRVNSAKWTKLSSQNLYLINDNVKNVWNYHSTLYSPNGKNGYSNLNPKIFQSYESDVLNNEQALIYANITSQLEYMNMRAVVHTADSSKNNIYGGDSSNTDYHFYNHMNYSPPDRLYPQGYFNGARSWNNFYPYERLSDDSETAISVVNGNNFGQCVRLKKIKTIDAPDIFQPDVYMLMISEPGALESFTIADSPANIQNSPNPTYTKWNHKVVPTFFPYGRIHFYQITKNNNALNIEYIRSCSHADKRGVVSSWLLTESYLKNQRIVDGTQRKIKTDPDKRVGYSNDLLSNLSSTNPIVTPFPSKEQAKDYNRESITLSKAYFSWSKNFIYNSNVDAMLPDFNPDIYPGRVEYAHIDYFGKSADFYYNYVYPQWNGVLDYWRPLVTVVTSSHEKFANFSFTNGLISANNTEFKQVNPYFISCSFIWGKDRANYPVDINYISMLSLATNAVTRNYPAPIITTATDYEIQYDEYVNFGNCIIAKDNTFFIGWNTHYRSNEYIFMLKATGYYPGKENNIGGSYVTTSHRVEHMVYSLGQGNFGNYIVVSDDKLLTNRYEYYDALGNLLTNPIDTILVYKLIYSDIRKKIELVFDSKVTPTIDYKNNEYYLKDQYGEVVFPLPIYLQIDSNTSYDNTNTSSASHIIDLDGKYDMYKNILFLQDNTEIAIFTYNDTLGKFIPQSHFMAVDPDATTDSIIRVGKSNAAATSDSDGEFDLGQFSSAIQILSYSSSLSMYAGDVNLASLGTYSSRYGQAAFNSNDLKYLPMYIKTNEVAKNALPLYTQSAPSNSGFLEMFIEPTKGKVEALETFIKVAEPSSGNLELFMSPKWYNTGRLNMVIAQKEKNQTFELHTVSYNPSSIFPLFLYNPINVTGTQDLNQNGDPLGGTQIIPSISMYIESFHTGIPNGSTIMPLSIKTIESLDHASPIPLSLNGNVISSSGGIDLYTYSAGRSDSSSGIDLYLQRSTSGEPYETSMYLFINRPDAAQMNLFIYNNYNSGNMNLSTSGAYMNTNNINLYCSSGVEQPSGNQNLFIRGSFTL